MRTGSLLLLISVLISHTALPQARRLSPQALHQGPNIAESTTVPFKLYRDYLIVVQGSMGPLERLNFLVDTGANPTAVDRKLARKLRLTSEETITITRVNGSMRVKRILLPTVRLGPIRAESLPAVIQDLDPVGVSLGVRVDGIIGFDVLSQSSFAIDYHSKRIVFGAVEPSGLSTPIHSGPPTFTVQLQVQDRPVSLLVDTGSANLIFFDCQLPIHEFPPHDLKALLNSSGVLYQLREVLVSKIRLGVADFGVKPALIADEHVNCDRSLDGVIGPSSLGLKWIAFDFDHLLFRWRR
jgi:predicted aspartyl protease